MIICLLQRSKEGVFVYHLAKLFPYFPINYQLGVGGMGERLTRNYQLGKFHLRPVLSAWIHWINIFHYCIVWNTSFKKEVMWMWEWVPPLLKAWNNWHCIYFSLNSDPNLWSISLTPELPWQHFYFLWRVKSHTISRN